MSQEQVVYEVLQALATLERPLTPWEQGFLDTVRLQAHPLTDGQKASLVKIAEEYVEDAVLVAALRAQLRVLV